MSKTPYNNTTSNQKVLSEKLFGNIRRQSVAKAALRNSMLSDSPLKRLIAGEAL